MFGQTFVSKVQINRERSNLLYKMQTATTLQLLDANNNNISPAVCVDSLYFEKTIETKTYRMTLKNRTIVASDTMNENFSINAPDIASLELPYFTVTHST